LKREAGEHTADRVESEIRSRIEFIAKNPGVGHFRRDLSSRDVKIYPAYSWLIIYRPNTRPLQVVSILHGRRDVANILKRQTN
jgi:antitoxin ParD1/3/4/toxin ParE1/3/4